MSSPSCATCLASIATAALKPSPLATKSVSAVSSTTAPTLPSTNTSTVPWEAARPDRLPAAARPFSRSQVLAFSLSPSYSSRARLQSIMPAPVIFRSAATSFAEMSAMVGVPRVLSGVGRHVGAGGGVSGGVSGVGRRGGDGTGVGCGGLGGFGRSGVSRSWFRGRGLGLRGLGCSGLSGGLLGGGEALLPEPLGGGGLGPGPGLAFGPLPFGLGVGRRRRGGLLRLRQHPALAGSHIPALFDGVGN